MSVLSKLKPQPLWDIFSIICTIPHPSSYEDALATYILQWAYEKNLFAKRDQIGNILIRKSATPGYENRCPVAIQAHLDMVPQKNSDTNHNFIQDSIQPWIDGEWVKARSTTLGADNGIGIASAMAVLAEDSIEHGPIEILLTVNEENGMKGAFSLQPYWLQSEILINTDSEEEGEICIGCASGVDFTIQIPLIRETLSDKYHKVQISLTGLKGGHSGSDIHLGLCNANKLLARFLADFCNMLDIRLLDINGGTLRNAIPREAFATLAIPYKNINTLRTKILDYLAIIKSELVAIEKNPVINVIDSQYEGEALTKTCSDGLISLLYAMPNGVIRMSNNIKGVVETSLNIGIISTDINEAKIYCLIRSLIESNKLSLKGMLHALAQLAGATTVVKESYPGWKPNINSPMLRVVRDTYQQLFNKTPNIKVIHAGLECGLFKKLYPDIDMISIGPTITGPHSPDEQVNIASVNQYWTLLTAILKAIPIKA